MRVDEPDPIPLSALQHWCYCPRQCALIHVEQVFADNLYTLRGQAAHRQTDQPGVEVRAGLRVERALPVWSDRLGLIGKADVVEFEPDGTPFPVEYKVGSRAKAPWIAACDDLQLAAQALCLEEMTGRSVPAGALYYAKSKRRRVVAIDAALRRRVEVAAVAVRALFDATVPPAPTFVPASRAPSAHEPARKPGQAAIGFAVLPAPTFDARCEKCSLADICQPASRPAAAGLFACGD
jgi:CRISPR-associated exonuclease Cas4